jgi:ribokinase
MGRLVVVGSYNRDTVLRVPRFPRPGETLAALSLARFHGGKGGNQAVAAARSGAQVAIRAAIGTDEAGAEALALWRAEGVDAAAVERISGAPTGEALILVDEAGENQIVILGGANDALPAQAGIPAIGDAALVLAQLETPIEATLAAFRAARRAGAATLLNAAPARPLPEEALALTDILIVNETEAALLLGRAGEAEVLARALAPRHARGVVLTAGAAGAFWACGDEVLHAPAPPTEVVDSTGAGDAFIGAFAAALVEGLAGREALRRGVAAGSLACRRAGAVPSLPRREAIEALLAAGYQEG